MIARDLRWSWQGEDVVLGLDEARSGPLVLLLPALSSISTRSDMHPLMERLASRFPTVAKPNFDPWTISARPATARHRGARGPVTIQDGVGDGRIGDQFVPVALRELAGHDGGGTSMPVVEDLQEITLLVGCERRQAPVIQSR